MSARRRGFTLIELLVVIAIIGILAAMLFPVFARARESARKVQCLSNVKNIAMAIQMYISDYDKFFPGEHDQRAIDYFNTKSHAKCTRDCCSSRLVEANPYLKPPVILDEYIKNREVWHCPSAKASYTFYIMDPYMNSTGTDDWLKTYIENQSSCPRPRACSEPFPSGWGGTVKASIGGNVWCRPEPGQGAFDLSVGLARVTDLPVSQVNDPVKYVVCADAGARYALSMMDTSCIAYPETCRLRSVGCDSTCGRDADCGTEICAPVKGDWRAATDPSYRKSHFGARHMGGENLGFADGHAKWMDAESILFDGVNASGYGNGPRAIENLNCCFVSQKTY